MNLILRRKEAQQRLERERLIAAMKRRIDRHCGEAPTDIIDGSKGYARVIKVTAEGDAREDYAADWLREWMSAR